MDEFYRRFGYVPVAEEQPETPGEYEVLRKHGTKHVHEDRYYWNGSYWVTKGHSPTKAVVGWKKGA